MLCRRLKSRSVTGVRPRQVTGLAVAALLFSSTIGLLIAPAAHAAPAQERAVAEYVVKKDDYLFGIAQKLGTPLTDLLAANSMTVDSPINPGDRLVVPANATNPTAFDPKAAAPVTPAAKYTVQSGDYLFGIARRLGTSLTSLLAANSMTANSSIDPGDELVVPATATNPTAAPATPAAAPAAATSTYTVKSGDYLFGIARMYNIKLGTLLTLNDLKSTSVLMPGATLQIPAGAVAITTSPGQAGSAATPPPPSGATKAEIVVAFARAQLGKPYRFNTAGPDTYDCSGLSAAAYAQVGLWLPHQSAMQSTRGVAVDWRNEDIKAGDLVFMFSSNHPNVISHLGIAINSWQWIHAPRSGDVVRIGLIPSDNVIRAVRRYVND